MDKIRFLLRLLLLIPLTLLIVACSHYSSQQGAKIQAVALPEATIAAALIVQPAATPTVVPTPTTANTGTSTTNSSGTDWQMWSTIINAFLAVFTLSGVLIALIIGLKNTQFAAHQEKVALDQLRHAFEATQISQKDLTLTAYANAVQGLLDHKRWLAEHPSIFETEIDKNRNLKNFIPEGMDVSTFLTFTSGFWRFSYVYSVMQRWEELGLTEKEYNGLKSEMLIWLQHVPGFFQVYDKFIRLGYNHNLDFLAFLEKEVYNQAWKDSHPDFLRIPKRKWPVSSWLSIRGNNRARI